VTPNDNSPGPPDPNRFTIRHARGPLRDPRPTELSNRQDSLALVRSHSRSEPASTGVWGRYEGNDAPHRLPPPSYPLPAFILQFVNRRPLARTAA
jgi:hypothetical protein